MSPIAARNVAAQITLTPGTVISRLIWGDSSASVAIKRSTASISESRNSIWRSAASTVSRSSVTKSSARSHSRPFLPNTSLNGDRPTSWRMSRAKNEIHAVLMRQLAATLQAPPHHPGALIGHPDRVELARGEQLRQGAGVEAVGLRSRLADPGVGGRDDDDLGDVGLDDSLDLPGVPGDLERDPVLLAEALGKELELFGLRRDPPRGADLAFLRDRHLAKLEMNVQSDRSHLLLLSSLGGEKLRAKRHRRIRARSATGQVAGAATDKARARSPSSKNRPTHLAFSQEAPVPIARPYGRTRTSASGEDFHLPTSRGHFSRRP